jgi:O-antigen ligase
MRLLNKSHFLFFPEGAENAVRDYLINTADIIIEAGVLSLLIFAPLAYGSVEVWSQTLLELALLFILFIWISKTFIDGRIVIYRSPVDMPLAVFFALVIVSRFISIYPHISQMAVYRVTAYTVLYWAVVNNFVSRRKLKRLSLYLIALATAISLIGILGYFYKTPLSSLWQYASFSTFTTTSHFCGYIGMVFPLGLALLLFTKGYKKVYFFFSCAVIIAAALLSQDRGGWVQFISAIIFLVVAAAYGGLLKRRGAVLLFIGILFAWAISIYGLPAIMRRLAPIFTLNFRASKEATIWERWLYWQDTLKMIKSHPVLGTGIGTFPIAFPQFRSPQVVNFINFAHQDFLQLAAEMGLAGLAVFAWLLFSFFKAGLNLLKGNIGSYRKALISGILAGACGLLVYSLYDFNLHIPSNAILFVVLIGLVGALSRLISIESGRENNFWLNRKLNIPLRLGVFLIAAYVISQLAVSIAKPYRAYLHYEKGRLFEEKFQWNKAINEYNKAKEADPRDALYYSALGNIYAARAPFDFLDKDYTELAVNNYNKAIRLNPYQGDYYISLANLYNILGNKELEAENKNKALSLDPNNMAYKELAR